MYPWEGECLAFRKLCNPCGQKNHFEKTCRSSEGSKSESRHDSRKRPGRAKRSYTHKCTRNLNWRKLWWQLSWGLGWSSPVIVLQWIWIHEESLKLTGIESLNWTLRKFGKIVELIFCRSSLLEVPDCWKCIHDQILWWNLYCAGVA